jgi:hypothetical protein
LSTQINPSTVLKLKHINYYQFTSFIDDDELREALSFFKDLEEMLLCLSSESYDNALQETLNTRGVLEGLAIKRGWKKNKQRPNGVMSYV